MTVSRLLDPTVPDIGVAAKSSPRRYRGILEEEQLMDLMKQHCSDQSRELNQNASNPFLVLWAGTRISAHLHVVDGRPEVTKCTRGACGLGPFGGLEDSGSTSKRRPSVVRCNSICVRGGFFSRDVMYLPPVSPPSIRFLDHLNLAPVSHVEYA